MARRKVKRWYIPGCLNKACHIYKSVRKSGRVGVKPIIDNYSTIDMIINGLIASNFILSGLVTGDAERLFALVLSRNKPEGIRHPIGRLVGLGCLIVHGQARTPISYQKQARAMQPELPQALMIVSYYTLCLSRSVGFPPQPAYTCSYLIGHEISIAIIPAVFILALM